LLLEAVGQARFAAEMGKIDQTFAQGRVYVVVGGQPFDLHVRCLCLDALRNLGNHLGQCRHRDPEHPVAGSGIEKASRRYDPAYAAQNGSYVLDDQFGERTGFHLAADTYQQRIAKLLPQSRQGVADGGLRAADPIGGHGDAPRFHQCFEDHEKVEVDPMQIDFVHDL
jgi:hypothetical protein